VPRCVFVWVSQNGSVVVQSPWYDISNDPDSSGIIVFDTAAANGGVGLVILQVLNFI